MTLRTVYKQVGNGWELLTLNQLIPGDVFRTIEADGEPLPGLWMAKETPVCENGVWGVIAEEVELQ